MQLGLGCLGPPQASTPGERAPPIRCPSAGGDAQGYLSLAPGPSARSEPLQKGFRDLGYIDGQTVVVEYRWTDGRLDRAQEAAAELVRLNVDVTGGPQATLAAKRVTSITPIVMALDYDPVGSGFVASSQGPAGTSPGSAASTRI